MQEKLAKIVDRVRNKGGDAQVIGYALSFALWKAIRFYASEVEECGTVE